MAENMQNDLPSSWNFILIGDVCSTTSGGTPSRKIKKYYEGKIPWLKSGELNDGLVSEIEEHITDEAIANSSAKIFPSGTLLIALYGATVGKLGILTKDAATNQAICAIFPPENVNKKYLFWYFRYIRSDLISSAIGGAQPNISQGIIKNTYVPIAPAKEQTRIVAEIEKQFSRLDEAVDNLKRVKANLKRYKAAVLKAAVEGKLTEEWRKNHPDVEPADKLLERILAERRKKWEEAELVKMKAKGKAPKDDKWKKKYKEPVKTDLNDLPALPQKWKWVTWDTILDFDKGAFKRGPFGSALKKSIFVDSGYKVYEQYCPINDDCSFARYFITDKKYEELKSFAVQAKDFLISCSGVTLGRITQVPDDYDEGIINQALLRVRLNNNIFDDSFFKILFRSPYFQKQIFKNSTGSAIPNVKGVDELKAIPLPLPIFKEQREIVKIFEEYLSVISVFDKQVDISLKRADRLRQSILKKAFSGKLVPNENPEKEINRYGKAS